MEFQNCSALEAIESPSTLGQMCATGWTLPDPLSRLHVSQTWSRGVARGLVVLHEGSEPRDQRGGPERALRQLRRDAQAVRVVPRRRGAGVKAVSELEYRWCNTAK